LNIAISRPFPHKVAVVLDREFGEKLVELSKTIHVWACGSLLNRQAAERIWSDGSAHNHEFGVTVFNISEGDTSESMFLNHLGAIDEHHGMYSHDPAWSVLEVYGSTPTLAMKEALKDYGEPEYKVTADGFIFHRNSGGNRT